MGGRIKRAIAATVVVGVGLGVAASTGDVVAVGGVISGPAGGELAKAVRSATQTQINVPSNPSEYQCAPWDNWIRIENRLDENGASYQVYICVR